MNKIPVTKCAAIIRTSFSKPGRWDKLKRLALEPPDPFVANFEFVDETRFKEKNVEDILTALPDEYPHSFLIIADHRAMTEEGFPCLVVDLLEGEGRQFRAIASALAPIENNLSIANMEFEAFADAVDKDGVFRGV